MAPSIRALLVEHREDTAAGISDYLAGRGHTVEIARDAASGLELATERDHDVVVLGISLPGLDGLALCRALRARAGWNTPVLLLGRDSVADRVDGFRAGADDTMSEPVSLEELEARLLALARRRPPGPTRAILRVSDLELDLGTRLARRAGRAIELSPASYTILSELMRASPNLVSKEQLERALWGGDLRGDDTLRSQIYLLRQAIDRPFPRRLLVTVRGIGYRLVQASEAA